MFDLICVYGELLFDDASSDQDQQQQQRATTDQAHCIGPLKLVFAKMIQVC
jgi:hypothetical protein